VLLDVVELEKTQTVIAAFVELRTLQVKIWMKPLGLDIELRIFFP